MMVIPQHPNQASREQIHLRAPNADLEDAILPCRTLWKPPTNHSDMRGSSCHFEESTALRKIAYDPDVILQTSPSLMNNRWDLVAKLPRASISV